MYGTITKYIGTAYTGKGLAHKYEKIIQQASETIFLKCPPTTRLSTMLNKLAAHFVKQGYHVDKFMNSTQTDEVDAVYIHDVKRFYLQASHPVALEPVYIGGRHHVISFYDMYNEQKLQEAHKEISELLQLTERHSGKALEALENAIGRHDQLEQINIEKMDWPQHEQLIETLKQNIFQSIQLNKSSTCTDRIVSSLTASGATDFFSEITYRMEKRFMIKGFAGTGKSTMMRAIATEAERRGLDVLYGWCGLDPDGIDLIQLPELSVAIFDATHPHAYEVERVGDEVVDVTAICKVEEVDVEVVEPIQNAYREDILNATAHLQSFAQAEKKLKIFMDQAIENSMFQKKYEKLIDLN